ncbi:MAG: hypothetical protein AAF696_30110 [Bacteroidota bacterium]
MKTLTSLLIAFACLSCFGQSPSELENFDYGKTDKGVYTNTFFGMKLSFNPEWFVSSQDQLKQIEEVGTEMAAGEDESLSAVIKASQVNTAQLLGISKYEWGAAVEFNPSLMLVAENTKLSPGIKTGKDYLFHAKRLLKVSQIEYYFEKEVYEKQIGNSLFYVLEAKFDYLGMTIIQEYISTVSKGFSLSFIVSYVSEKDRKELEKFIDNIEI